MPQEHFGKPAGSAERFLSMKKTHLQRMQENT